VIRRSCVRAAALAVVAFSSAAAANQPQDAAATLRTFLVKYGFDEAITAANAPDLDRPLANWGVSVVDTTVVIAYDYKDAGAPRESTPLHVSRFDRTGARWVHTEISDLRGGAINSVTSSDLFVVVDLHVNPSTNQGIVLDAATLRHIGDLKGYDFRLLRDGSILFFGGMRHFAPIHQASLRLFKANEPEVELFPGPQPSPLASVYRKSFLAAADAVPPEAQVKFRIENRSPRDFDRDIAFLQVVDDDSRLAFAAFYDSDVLREFPHPTLETLVRCDRRATLRWVCRESELAEQSRRLKVALEKNQNGRYDPTALQAVIGATLKQR
jgi:hypothetical protein